MSGYQVAREQRGEVEVVTLGGEGQTFARIVPAYGSNCYELGAGDSVLEPIAWEIFAAKPTSYGIPILFPYANRIRDGRFEFGGRSFSVDPLQHGYVRQRPWQVVDSGATNDRGAWLRTRFESNDFADELHSQFPFAFRLDAEFLLRDRTFEITFTIANESAEEFPCGLGIHPYFRRPRRGTVTVPAAERWALDEKLPTGERVAADGEYDLRGGADAATVSLDDIYTALDADASGIVRCAIDDAERKSRTVVEFAKEDFPNVVVYTAPEPRWALCVEPMTSPTDAFNLAARGVDANVLVLAPGATRRLSIRIVME